MTENEQRNIFHNWLTDYRGLIFKIIRAYTDIEEDRDDLFQEVAIQLWRSIPNFQRRSAETTWIYRVGINTAIRWFKKEEKQRRTKEEAALDELLLSKEVQNDWRLDWLYDQIKKLNEVDRSICLLMLDDLSYKEMALIIGISETNLGVKIHRIKKYLTEQSKKTNHGI